MKRGIEYMCAYLHAENMIWMIYSFIASINHPKKCYQSTQKTSDPFLPFENWIRDCETKKKWANGFIDSN